MVTANRGYFTALLLLSVSGCSALDQQKPATTPEPKVQTVCQRFVPVSPSSGLAQGVPWHGFFALDTQTGQLCRTTDFEFSSSRIDWNTLPACTLLLDPPRTIMFDSPIATPK